MSHIDQLHHFIHSGGRQAKKIAVLAGLILFLFSGELSGCIKVPVQAAEHAKVADTVPETDAAAGRASGRVGSAGAPDDTGSAGVAPAGVASSITQSGLDQPAQIGSDLPAADDVLTAESGIGQQKISANPDDGTQGQDTGEQEPETEGSAAGLSLSKQVQANADGTWTVTLESYVTGQEKSAVQAADIVLLLDVSGSMSYFSYDGAATRLDALKGAVNNFIDVVAGMNRRAEGEDQIRIAMAQFSSEDRSKILCDFTEVSGDGVSALKKQTQQLTGKGVTRTDCALGLARQLLEKDKSGRRARYVILFTDGQPNDSDGFQPSVANRALASAESIKQAGGQIYVISIAPNSYAGNGGKLPSYQKSKEDTGSNEKFIYVSPSLTYDNGPEINTTETNVTAMTNRFMHLISSNNPNASDMDIPDEKNAKNPGRTMAEDGTGYYLTALDTEGLTDAFHSLAYQIGTSDLYLGTSAQLRDVVTEWFALDAASVQVYTSARMKNADGTFSWGERQAADGVALNILSNQKTISVKGFDYSGNYVSTGGHVDDPTDFGRKLICEFTLRRGSTIGGNHIPTNTGESGVYRNRLLDSCAGRFPIPYADVPIDYGIAALDYAVYVPDQISLPDMLSYLPEHTPDGQNNAFVDIHYVMKDAASQNVWAVTIPAGRKADQLSWNWNRPKADHCQQYSIECTVTPSREGTVPAWNGTVTATAHVFRPTVTLKDTSQARGETADVMIGNSLSSEGLKKHYVKTVWKCDDDHASRRANEPKLGFCVSPLAGIENEEGKFVVATDGDAALSVRVYRTTGEKLTDEITQYTAFAHTCTKKNCTFDTQQGKDDRVTFLIHAGRNASDPDGDKGQSGETGGGIDPEKENGSSTTPAQDAGSGKPTSAGDAGDDSGTSGGTGNGGSSAGVDESGGSSSGNTAGGSSSSGGEEQDDHSSGDAGKEGTSSGGTDSGAGSGSAGQSSSGNSGTGSGQSAAATDNGTAQQSMTKDQQAARENELRQQQQALTEAYAAGVAAANNLHVAHADRTKNTSDTASETASGSTVRSGQNSPDRTGAASGQGANTAGAERSASGAAGGKASGTAVSGRPASVQDRPRTGDTDAISGWGLVLMGACILVLAYVIIIGHRERKS